MLASTILLAFVPWVLANPVKRAPAGITPDVKALHFFQAIMDENPVKVRHFLNEQTFDYLACCKESLPLASGKSSPTVLKMILNDSRTNMMSRKGHALVPAAKYRRVENLKILLQRSSCWPMKAVILAIDESYDSPECIDLLKEYLKTQQSYMLLTSSTSLKNPQKFHSKFLQAITNGDIVTVKRLIASQRVDPAAEDNIALKLACSQGKNEIAQLLMMFKDVDPAVEDKVCLTIAVQSGNLDLIEMLLENIRPKVISADAKTPILVSDDESNAPIVVSDED